MKKRVVDRQRFEGLVNKFADELPKRAVDGSLVMEPREVRERLARTKRPRRDER